MIDGVAPGLTPARADEPDEVRAGRGLEAFFLRQLLAETRGTGGMLSGGFAGETFQAMLDEAMADAMANAGLGLADTFAAALSGEPGSGAEPSVVVDADEFDRALGRATAGPPPAGVAPALALPVHGRVSSGFGPRVDPVHGARGNHTGLDLAAPTGTPVVAAAAGTVVRAGDAGGYGQLIVLRHADGSETRYAHLSAIGVEVGAQVARGQPIGAVGSTGRSTGPHLHFELRRNGQAVDPRPALPLGPPSTTGAGGRTTSLEKPDAH